MAEYATGTTGRIYIEDAGDWIHIDIDARQGTTNIGTGWFDWSDPLGSGSGTYSYPAGSGRKRVKSLGPFGPGQGGTVYFTLRATGTQGLGGPTSVSFGFSRSTVPPPPNVYAPHSFTFNSFRTNFAWAGDGGAAVDAYEVHYSNNPGGGQFSLQTGDGQQLINVGLPNFPPGGPVYYWVRAHNAVGWGSFNGPAGGRLLAGNKTKVSGAWRDSVAYVKVNGDWRPCIPYVKKAGVWTMTTD